MTDKQLVVEAEQNPMMALINRAATDPAFDVAKLEHLLAVKERWEKDEARKAYMIALTEFKSDPPQIHKNKKVAFKDVKYSHASLDQVSTLIGAALSKQGISHSWNVEQQAAAIKVTCVLTHSKGHSESVSMTSAADQSGSKNSIQALGSAVTYLQRYTLLAATGMAVKDDDDGKASGAPKPAAAPIPGPQEAAPVLVSTQGSSNVKITGVFQDKVKKAFRIQGELAYWVKLDRESLALAAKALFKAGEEAKIEWTRGTDGVYWVDSIDRVTAAF